MLSKPGHRPKRCLSTLRLGCKPGGFLTMISGLDLPPFLCLPAHTRQSQCRDDGSRTSSVDCLVKVPDKALVPCPGVAHPTAPTCGGDHQEGPAMSAPRASLEGPGSTRLDSSRSRHRSIRSG